MSRGLGRQLSQTRPIAGEHVMERRAQGVDVDPLIRRLAARLLGCHVGGRAGTGERESAAVVAIRSAVLGRRRQILGEPPVDDHGLAEGADEDVLRLEVAVDHPLAVRVRDGLDDRDEVGEEPEALVEGLQRGHDPIERAAGHILHGVERFAARPASGFVDAHDGRMLELGGQAGLVLEARPQPLVDELLDGDRAPQPPVARANDVAHAAAADLRTADVVLVGDDAEVGEVEIRLERAGHQVGNRRSLELARQGHARCADLQVSQERALALRRERPDRACCQEGLGATARKRRRGGELFIRGMAHGWFRRSQLRRVYRSIGAGGGVFKWAHLGTCRTAVTANETAVPRQNSIPRG